MDIIYAAPIEAVVIGGTARNHGTELNVDVTTFETKQKKNVAMFLKVQRFFD